MIKNYDQSVEINHNPNLHYISDHPYKTLIIRGSGSGKTKVLLNLIRHQRPDLTKFIYLSKTHLNQGINCLLTEKKLGVKKLKNPKAFIDYSQTIDYVYKNLEGYNPTKKKESVNRVWWYDSRYGI